MSLSCTLSSGWNQSYPGTVIALAQQQDRVAVLSHCEAEFGGHLRRGKEEKKKGREEEEEEEKKEEEEEERNRFISFSNSSVFAQCVNASSVKSIFLCHCSTIVTFFVFAASCIFSGVTVYSTPNAVSFPNREPAHKVWERG